MSAWITTLEQTAPLYVWIASAAATVVLMVVIIRAVRRQRAAEPSAERMSRLQLIGALAFSSVVIAAFMIGTFEGGVAFAHDMLGWNDWRRVIPWGSFDAASIGFSLFAIRAIGRGRSPRAAMRVVYLSAASSACVQLMEGGGLHKWQGGLFLAALAATSAMVLHNIMDQLSGRATIKQVDDEKLRFGKRWFTSMPSTLCAWLAWTNFPDETLAPTVPNALRHLKAVRATKRAEMSARPGWRFVQPWLYANRMAAAAEQVRAELAAEQTRADDANRNLSAAVQTARAEGEQVARAYAEQTIETLRTEIRDLNNDRASRVTVRRSEPMPARRTAQEVTKLATDDQLIKDLFATFSEQTAKAEQNGTRAPGRYWVEQNGGVASRQANRVLDGLLKCFAEQNRSGREQAPGQVGEQASEQTDDPDRELAEMTG